MKVFFLSLCCFLFALTQLRATDTLCPPSNVRITKVFFGEAMVEWDNNCDSVIKYQMELKLCGKSQSDTLDINVLINKIILKGLLPGECYQLCVRNVYSGNRTSECVSLTAYLPGACPPPDNFRVLRMTPRRVQVAWDPSPYAEQYFVHIRPVGQPNNITYYPGQWTNRTFIDLQPGTEYEYRVRVLCPANKYSTYTVWRKFTTPLN